MRHKKNLHGLAQLVGKKTNIHDRLGDVGIQMRQVLGKLVNVLREQLIRILQTVINVGDLVKGDAIQILVVGELHGQVNR